MTDKYDLASALGLALIDVAAAQHHKERAEGARTLALVAIARSDYTDAEKEEMIASAESYAQNTLAEVRADGSA